MIRVWAMVIVWVRVPTEERETVTRALNSNRKRTLLGAMAGCTLFLSIILPASPPQTARAVPQSIFNHAVTALQQARYGEAEHILRDALRKYGDEPDLLGLLGVTLDSANRYPEA